MFHLYTKCLAKVLQVSPYFQMKIWDLIKHSELAWSIKDLSRHNAPIIDYLFKHKQDLQKDWICLNRNNYKIVGLNSKDSTKNSLASKKEPERTFKIHQYSRKGLCTRLCIMCQHDLYLIPRHHRIVPWHDQ
jgi:hypothetical protein